MCCLVLDELVEPCYNLLLYICVFSFYDAGSSCASMLEIFGCGATIVPNRYNLKVVYANVQLYADKFG